MSRSANDWFGLIFLPIQGAISGFALVLALRLFLDTYWWFLWLPGLFAFGALIFVVHTITAPNRRPTGGDAVRVREAGDG